jgi:hypothetical protein
MLAERSVGESGTDEGRNNRQRFEPKHDHSGDCDAISGDMNTSATENTIANRTGLFIESIHLSLHAARG